MADSEILTQLHAVQFSLEVAGDEPFCFHASLTRYPKELEISYADPEKPLGKYLLTKLGLALKIKEDGFIVPSSSVEKVFNRVIGMYLPTAKPVE